MAWRARLGFSERGAPPDGESSPRYLRVHFVVGMVLLAALLGFTVTRIGPARTAGDPATAPDAAPKVDVGAGTTPRSTDPDDCPDPGAQVPLAAAELVTILMAAVADPTVGRLPASEEVQRQIDATDPAPPLTRMTRVRGFAGQSDTWSTCVISYWMGAEGPMQSLDVVTVAVVDANHGEDTVPEDGGGDGGESGGESRGDEDDDGDRSERNSRSPGPQWEVTRWLRGEPRPTPRSRVASLGFFHGSGCSKPDREVSVAIPDAPPDSRLRSALEELISGTVGRSPTASSSVPLDTQVLEAGVDGPFAKVVLTPTANRDMSRCEGTAAYAQVVETATAIARESLMPEGDGEAPDVAVEVIVAGRPVDTLRP